MTHDGLTQIERLRLHVNCDLSEPCLDSLLDEVDDLEAEVARLQEALGSVMVGGNHLATRLPADAPSHDADHLTALEQMGATVEYDIWCCWKSIMIARAALEDTP